MKRISALSAIFCTLWLLAGCAADAPAPAPEPVPEPQPQIEAPSKAEKLLDSMTTEEKVGQLFFVRVPEENAAADAADYHLGGYILFGRDTQDKTFDQLSQTIRSYQEAADIPLLIGVDEEGGTVNRVSRNPALRDKPFSSPQELMAQGGMEALLGETAEKDLLLRSLGINVNLAPVADVSTDPADFIYGRAFGQDAEATADYVGQVVRQMDADGMGSVLKHFPGYGNNVDTHTGIAVDERPLSRFEAEDFLPFRAGFESGSPAVMVSHNIITAVDEALPASLSPAVHQLLREELGFDGVVMTDDLAMDAVSEYAGSSTAAVLAVKAGNDMLITGDYREQIPQVLQALDSGELTMEQIDIACLRVLEWKDHLGLLP